MKKQNIIMESQQKITSPSYEAALDELGYEPFEKELVRLLIQDLG